jgi:hypothetical protein
MQDQRWWSLEKTESERGATMSAVITFLENVQTDRTLELLRYMSIYSNRPMTDLAVVYTAEGVPAMPRQILNTTGALVDTLVSKHVQAESRCQFFTEDGDWEAHMKAEALDTAVYGEFERMDLYMLAEMAFRDALVCGDGWLKFSERAGKVYAERTFPLEIILDEESCYSAPPTEIYQRRYLTEEWLVMTFPDMEEEIKGLQGQQPPYAWPSAQNRKMHRLDEGWHVDPVSKTGRHIIACGDVVFLDEKWEYDTFPFQRISWSPSQMGGYAIGLVEELAPLQLEMNVLLRRIHQAIKLMAVPRIWQQAGTKVSPEYDNMIGNVYKYAGVKPEIDSGSGAVAPELFKQVDWLEQRMYKKARLSEMEAAGQMQSRNDSRPALREAIEVASATHAWVGKMWERFFVGCAKHVMRVAGEIPGYSTTGRDKNAVVRFKWSEIALEADQVAIKMAPANPAALSPTGKRQAAQQLIDYGIVDDKQEIAQILIDVPDIKAIMARETSDRTLIEKHLWQITRKREEAHPDEFIDPVRAIKMARQAYAQASVMKNTPAEVLSMLVDYIRECETLLPEPPPQVPEIPMAPGMAPPGAAPGVMPNVPGSPLPPSVAGAGPLVPPGGVPALR